MIMYCLIFLSRQAIHELKLELERIHENDVENVKNEIKSNQGNQQLKDLQVGYNFTLILSKFIHEASINYSSIKTDKLSKALQVSLYCLLLTLCM